MSTIKCPSCGHENEASRVFCHNCGVRLPRPDGVVAEITKKNQVAQKTAADLRRRAVKKPVKKFDYAGFLGGIVGSVLKLAISSAVAACVILLFRQPDRLPTPIPEDAEIIARLDNQLAQAAESGFKGTISASPAQINSYLAGRVRLIGRSLGPLGEVVAQPPIIVPDNDRFTLFVRYETGGVPMSIQTTFALSGDSLLPVSGAIGRMPLPAFVFTSIIRWYFPIGNALETQLSILQTADTLRITPALGTAVWSTPAPPTPTDSTTSTDSNASSRAESPFDQPTREDAIMKDWKPAKSPGSLKNQ